MDLRTPPWPKAAAVPLWASLTRPALLALLVFSVSLAVYLLTMSPTIFDGPDTIEFVVLAYKLGIPHPPGYPLYLLLGKLFTYLPVGDVGFRVNLMSAAFGAGAAALVFQLTWMLTGQKVISLAAALVFAFSFYVWELSVLAEVYTLHAFLTALILLLWFKWEERADKRLIYAAAVALGLALGNHLTIGTLALPFAYIGLRSWRQGRLRFWDLALLALVFMGSSALIYAYLPWRHLEGAFTLVGHFNGDGGFTRINLASPSGLWWMLSGKEYDSLLFAYGPRELVGEVSDYLHFLTGNFLAVGLALGVIGAARSAFASRHHFIVLALAFGANFFFFVNYGAWDKETMYLPTYVVWAVWIGQGAAYVVSVLREERPQHNLALLRPLERAIARAPWACAALLMPLAALWLNFSYADVSQTGQVEDDYHAFLKGLPPNSLVVAWYLDAWPLIYFQQVEGERLDVQVVDRFRISRAEEVKLIDRATQQRQVYVFGFVPRLTFPNRVEEVWRGTHDQGYLIHRVP